MMSKLAEAAPPEVVPPPTVPVGPLLVLTKLPFAALPGKASDTLKLHCAPAANCPPLKLITPVPATLDPAPQTLFCGKPVAAAPGSNAAKSSLNPMPLADNVVEVFCSV